MNPTVVGVIAFACMFGGVLVGMGLRAVLPKHHLDSDSKDTIKVGIGLIATMTALVLGLVTASAKSSFDSVDSAVKQSAMQFLALDRTLARYGPETGEVRTALKNGLGTRIEMIWPRDPADAGGYEPVRAGEGSVGEALADAIRSLRPGTDLQRSLQSRALDLAETLLQARWIVVAENTDAVPLPFLTVLLFWLTVSFASFGLFAPRNLTVLAVLFVCALSVASALFMVLEMEAPFSGLIRVSGEPLRYAWAHLNL